MNTYTRAHVSLLGLHKEQHVWWRLWGNTPEANDKWGNVQYIYMQNEGRARRSTSMLYRYAQKKRIFYSVSISEISHIISRDFFFA